MAECKAEKREITYTLTLSSREAAVVMFVLGYVTGDHSDTWRGLNDGVFNALSNAGVPDMYGKLLIRGSPVIQAVGPYPEEE